ncbi:MAG TPA: chromosome segregation protein SMC [Bryobacteraceae bacterium]
MLKLKRVEIHGFKSFYDRTEMKFNGSGIAAVVGPNGCGKSNLSDAMSWVLGEQSAKSLRGARMEDVIFAGTGAKKPLGMASVTMTLVPDEWPAGAHPGEAGGSHRRELRHRDPQIDETPGLNGTHSETLPFSGYQPDIESTHTNSHSAIRVDHAPGAGGTGEITITRRLYRSGDSEYLINNRPARLRDIQDLFLGTGLGPESYAIIEQGRIGQILSNKPQDRRAVIEEAAGITKFKSRKRLAEAKLESAKQNLSRVFDILEEVTRQANSLKRQAAKTRRYTELKAEATGHLRRILAAKFRMLQREMTKVAIELNLASAELQDAQAAIGKREVEQTQIFERSYATEQDLTATRKLIADLSLEAERARGRLEYQQTQIQQIDQRLTAGQHESQSLERERRQRAAELQHQATELDAVESECARARQQLEAKSEERQQAQEGLAEQERGLEASQKIVLRLLDESATLRNRITQIEAQMASAERDTMRAQTEEQQSARDQARLEEQGQELSGRLAARQTELISVTAQRAAVDQELQQKRAERNEIRHAVDQLRSEFSRIKARKDSLEDVIQHRSYTTETVKRLFTAAERGKAEGFEPVGLLADFLEVDPQFEKATEEFLHDELEYVVVRDWAAAECGIDLMRSDLNGRATFLAEESGATTGNPAELPQPATEGGTLSRLAQALRLTNGLSKVSIQLLPRIANCYVASDRVLARHLAMQFPHCWFLTSEGVNYHGNAVSGGKKSGAGPLALKRELREVLQIEAVKEQELEEGQSRLASLEQEITALSERQEDLRLRQQIQEKEVLALDHESRKLAEELQRVQSKLSHARLELDRIARECVKLQENLELDRAELSERERARLQEETALAGAREALTGLKAEVARTADEHAGLRANLASLEERGRSLAANRERLEIQARDFANRQAHLEQETESLTAERAQLLASNGQLEAKAAEIRLSITAAEETVNRLAGEEAALRGQLGATEEELKSLRGDAQIIQGRRSEMQVLLARAESDLNHLEETCQKELETTLAQLVEGAEADAAEPVLQDTEAKYAEVLRKIESLGPVNPQALEEFEEAQQRQEFLTAQRQDLLDSIRDTENAIQQIDSESRKRFGEAFHAVNANFREMFKTLFGGGTGEMRLADEENLAESGIDIVASPPGKKLQSVLLLSGGEKSLTAMALLMAIFQYTPSPFCILDEVDAPLDEPNIERLTRLLKEMAEQTQFIVITHAKRTMEAAQSLYGVTMQEPGVSRLVSVKFKAPAGSRHEESDKLIEAVIA